MFVDADVLLFVQFISHKGKNIALSDTNKQIRQNNSKHEKDTSMQLQHHNDDVDDEEDGDGDEESRRKAGGQFSGGGRGFHVAVRVCYLLLLCEPFSPPCSDFRLRFYAVAAAFFLLLHLFCFVLL